MEYLQGSNRQVRLGLSFRGLMEPVGPAQVSAKPLTRYIGTSSTLGTGLWLRRLESRQWRECDDMIALGTRASQY